MLDRIPERLRTAAEGVAKATQMMADAKSRRNQAAGDVGACYSGLDKEQTAEWQAADMIERNEEHYQAAMAMNEKHRKLWVEACQQRDRLRAALEKIVSEAESDDGLTAWDGADIARAALQR